MPQLQHRIILAEPAGQTAVGRALEHLRSRVDVLDMCAVDMAAHEPEQLGAHAPFISDSSALVLAIGRQEEGGAGQVDWRGKVHDPLQRCFTIIRGVVPAFVARRGGAAVVVVLPSTALFADSGKCAESVLGRCLVGLSEGLRAELLSTATKVTIVIDDEREGGVGMADRIDEALRRAPLYLLPASVSAARISAVFDPWLGALARTASDLALPPLGPMGEVYRTELEGAGRIGPPAAEMQTAGLAKPSPPR